MYLIVAIQIAIDYVTTFTWISKPFLGIHSKVIIPESILSIIGQIIIST